MGVRHTTDNVYLVDESGTYVMNGGTGEIVAEFPTGGSCSVCSGAIVINQTSGKVYIINESSLEAVTIIQDRGAPTFSDVPSTYWAWQYIESLYNSGITGGCATNPLSYCPTSPVTRAQMAVFLLKGIHGSSFAPPAVGGNTGFTDVDVTHWAAAWIKQLAAEAITSGCGSGIYCPENTVTRAQMAVFLLKATHGSSYSPPNVSATFGDTSGHWAEDWIEQLAAEGITSGCAAGLYCPENPVTRDQMAVFLVKAFNLP
ncbi:MAG TPA: S-layer homology domain-containing protein [Saprospiraceae bacterium]|nr:S-layer homology domain-containing protein [Saprospiraceae bacterium]